MMAFHNGRFQEAAEVGLSIADAGLVFAATVTDFCRTYQQRLFRWPEHLSRFRSDCAQLQIPVNYSEADLTEVAQELLRHNRPLVSSSQELALISFATPGPLGYLLGQPDSGPPTLVMHMFPLNPDRYRVFQDQGVVLQLAGVLPTHPASLVPMEVKHRSRLSWWLADRGPRVPGRVPCLVNESFEVPDTAIGSVLLVQDEVIYRSPPGTVLESISLGVVEELARREGLRFEVKRLHWPELLEPTSEVLLVGSGFGLAGVRELIGLDQDSTRIPWPGPMLLRLQQAWNELVLQEAQP